MVVKIEVELPSEAEAWALAEACKRFSHGDAMRLAKDEDEAWQIVVAMDCVRRGLNAIGMYPR